MHQERQGHQIAPPAGLDLAEREPPGQQRVGLLVMAALPGPCLPRLPLASAAQHGSGPPTSSGWRPVRRTATWSPHGAA